MIGATKVKPVTYDNGTAVSTPEWRASRNVDEKLYASNEDYKTLVERVARFADRIDLVSEKITASRAWLDVHKKEFEVAVATGIGLTEDSAKGRYAMAIGPEYQREESNMYQLCGYYESLIEGFGDLEQAIANFDPSGSGASTGDGKKRQESRFYSAITRFRTFLRGVSEKYLRTSTIGEPEHE